MEKIGIIELQTTSVKLVIANVLDNRSFIVTDKREDRIKIASDISQFELIKQPNIAALSTILKTYKALLFAYDITNVQCVASCEYLNAKNHRSFFDELHGVNGFRFRILTPEEQANSLYLAFINTLDCPKGVVLSINGTNVQILAYSRRNVLNQIEVKTGTVNLAEKYENQNLSPAQKMEAMKKEFDSYIAGIDWFEGLDEETQIVGTGDAFLSFAKLSKKLRHYPYAKNHSYQFSKEDFDKVYDFVATLDIDKTKKLKGISSERADVLASAMSIMKSVAEKSNIQKFIVSEAGIAEGTLFGYNASSALEKPLTDVLGTSLETITMFYNGENLKNIQNIYEISLILFKQLKVLHKLPRNFVKVLRIASYMHDSGKRISNTDYQKKGFNVVLDSDIMGVNHREQVLASFVVACQNLDDFSMTDWVKYSSILLETDLDSIRKLAVIVNLATKLDMFNTGKVKDISCDILGDSVIMKTIVESPADLEVREALKVSSDFVKAFKKHIEIL